MVELINHNSAILFGIAVLLVGAFILNRRGLETRRVAAFAALVVVVAVGFFTLRPSPGTDYSAFEIDTVIGSGTPVLLEFQSQN